MEKENPTGILEEYTARQLAHSLNMAMAPARDLTEAFECIVQEAAEATRSSHVFLSRFDATERVFRTVACRSAMCPGDVGVDRKFMGGNYLNGQPVIAHDLSKYSYRMRPETARLGLASLVGIPIMVGQEMAGVLEAFSEKPDHYSDADVELLLLLAKHAALLIERLDRETTNRYCCAENDFLLEALKLEQTSVVSMFYKVGEVFASVLGVQGVAVFGVDHKIEADPLQEMMSRGFSPADIDRLKKLYNKEALQNLVDSLDFSLEYPIVKQAFKRDGAGGNKMLYVVPVMYKRVLYGLVVFYWTQLDYTRNMKALEDFIRRMTGHIIMVLSRKELYSNIQKISFSDILTGLANRRLFDYVLDRELKKTKRSKKPISLLLIDVDHFKTIRDTYGSQVANSLLEQLGLIMKESFRSSDLPARYSEEEFAVILPDADKESALAIAERFRQKAAECRFSAGGRQINITVSIGGASYDHKASAANVGCERLVLAADQALHQARQLGRDLTVFSGAVSSGPAGKQQS